MRWSFSVGGEIGGWEGIWTVGSWILLLHILQFRYGNLEARLGKVRLQRPEALRASAVSASQRANEEKKAILAPGVTSLMTIYFRRSDLHSHMLCRASYKINQKKSKRDGRAAENTEKCTIAELSARGSPVAAGLPFSPAPHRCPGEIKKLGKKITSWQCW